MEEWKEVPDFPGYFVSNTGLVRGARGKLLSQETVRGYKRVSLCIAGKVTRFTTHRLVMLAFVGPSDLDVRHLDGDSTNNCLRNLAYGTKSENEQDKRLVGTYQRHEKNPFAILTKDQVDWVKDIYAHHLIARRLQGFNRARKNFKILVAQELGVSVGCIKNITMGKCWQC